MEAEDEQGIQIRVYTPPLNNYENIKLDRFGDFRIDFPLIKNSIDEVLNNWYDLKIESSMLLYLRNVTHSKNMLLEDRFLGYAKALESAHREDTLITNKFVDEHLYKQATEKMLSVVKDEIPNDLMNKLESVLKHANEFGFQRRIKDIIKSLDDNIKEHVLLGLCQILCVNSFNMSSPRGEKKIISHNSRLVLDRKWRIEAAFDSNFEHALSICG